jgi:FMN reductase [NAD(P)H]
MGPIAFIRSLVEILQAKPQIPESLKESELLRIITNRRSVRKFSQEAIPDDVFGAILEAGRLAPSTVNLQTWTFITFTGASWKEHFGRQVPFKGDRAIIVLGDIGRTKKVIPEFPRCPLVEYTIAVMNASLAAMSMNIAAEALGVSSVMLSETGRTGFFDARFLKEKLSLPDGVFPLMTIVLGYAKMGYPPMPPKLPRETIFTDIPQYKEGDRSILVDWYDQMTAGFKVARPLSSFRAQLEYYRRNIERAEGELGELIFYGGDSKQRDEVDRRPQGVKDWGLPEISGGPFYMSPLHRDGWMKFSMDANFAGLAGVF